MASALQPLSGRLRRTIAPLRERIRQVIRPIRLRLNGEALRRYVLGDPSARNEHLRVAAALGGATTVTAVLTGMAGLVASPIVWGVLLLGGGSLLAVLVTANGYWRGGLAAAYALLLAPIFGAVVGTAATGQFTGFGFTQVAAVLLCAVLVPVVHGVGRVGRYLREVTP